MKSVTLLLMILLNVVQSSFFKCTIYTCNHGLCNGHYVPLVFMLLPGKSESINRSMWSAISSLCKRHILTFKPTTVHIDFEVAMHTVLNNAQCTFKNEL